MARRKDLLRKVSARATVTARMVREQARQLHGLDFSEARSAELAQEVERHTAAIGAASARLDFNDEPARFTALLRPAASRGKRR